MGKLSIHTTSLEGLYAVETEPFVDHSGAFARWFCKAELAEIIGTLRIKNTRCSGGTINQYSCSSIIKRCGVNPRVLFWRRICKEDY